jgi:hypothetical protein
MGMTKSRASYARSPKPAKSGGVSGAYKAAGKLPDGVTILAPKSKPKHFTAKQIQSTIREVRRDSASGRFTGVKG